MVNNLLIADDIVVVVSLRLAVWRKLVDVVGKPVCPEEVAYDLCEVSPSVAVGFWGVEAVRLAIFQKRLYAVAPTVQCGCSARSYFSVTMVARLPMMRTLFHEPLAGADSLVSTCLPYGMRFAGRSPSQRAEPSRSE